MHNVSTPDVHSAARAAWDQMTRDGISPTPRNYDIWFTYFTGITPGLNERMDEMRAGGQPITAARMDALYRECIATEFDIEAFGRGFRDIQDVTRTMMSHVAAGRDALRSFGSHLTEQASVIEDDASEEAVRGAVRSLTIETRLAAERNRVLEEALSSSIQRVAALQQQLLDVEREALTDGLTGLANRKRFDAVLRRAVAEHRQGLDLCLLLIDIDNFKSFNDTHGHRTGDQVLRLVGKVLTDNVKGRDTAARYGGEEFAIVLAGATVEVGAKIAEQIRETLSRRRLVIKSSGQALGCVTVSVGVARLRPGEDDAEFVERADRLLYEAKRTGRNRVCIESVSAVAEMA